MSQERNPPPAAEDAPTQQIRRPVRTSLPGPLDLTGPAPEGDTDVMSIHDLLDVAAEPVPAGETVVSSPVVDPVAVADAPPPPAASPRGSGAMPSRSSEIRQRLRADSAAALTAARSQTVTWMRTGDNGLVAATAAIALLLLLVLMIVH